MMQSIYATHYYMGWLLDWLKKIIYCPILAKLLILLFLICLALQLYLYTYCSSITYSSTTRVFSRPCKLSLPPTYNMLVGFFNMQFIYKKNLSPSYDLHLNTACTVVFYMMRRSKQDINCIYFDDILQRQQVAIFIQ